MFSGPKIIKELTAQEVKKNYRAYKNRFNL